MEKPRTFEEERLEKGVEGLKVTPWRVREQPAREPSQPAREHPHQQQVEIQVDESLHARTATLGRDNPEAKCAK